MLLLQSSYFGDPSSISFGRIISSSVGFFAEGSIISVTVDVLRKGRSLLVRSMFWSKIGEAGLEPMSNSGPDVLGEDLNHSATSASGL